MTKQVALDSTVGGGKIAKKSFKRTLEATQGRFPFPLPQPLIILLAIAPK
jgi:hypothetical protein